MTREKKSNNSKNMWLRKSYKKVKKVILEQISWLLSSPFNE